MPLNFHFYVAHPHPPKFAGRYRKLLYNRIYRTFLRHTCRNALSSRITADAPKHTGFGAV